MRRSFKDYLIISFKGMAMGAADVVPGVSGGTIAFISGIYEELINTISGVKVGLLRTWKDDGFKAMWAEINGNFIVALLSGIIFSFFTIMRLANYLLEEHPILIWSFFFGLVLASVYYVGKQIPKWTFNVFLFLILGAGIAFYITSLPPMTAAASDLFLFFAGAIAICAMILPGISGAFILVLLGAYKTVSEATNDFDFKTLGIVALGAIFGLLSFSRLLKWLFVNYSTLTLATLTGFIAGSLNKIWPWKLTLETAEYGDKSIVIRDESVMPWNFDAEPHSLQAFVLMLAGFILILILEGLAEKKPAQEDAGNTNV
jgi:putative membrane protein